MKLFKANVTDRELLLTGLENICAQHFTALRKPNILHYDRVALLLQLFTGGFVYCSATILIQAKERN